jgi:long-subunit acyl-CoA synthetase (AMP-forming)
MISHRNIIAQLHQVKAYTRDVHPKVVLGVLPFHHSALQPFICRVYH